MKTRLSRLSMAAIVATIGMSAACGGTDTAVNPPPATPPPTPAATLSATGDGALVLHPSLDPTFTFALEAPIRIMETAGGTADWNYARISYFLNGAEIERYELGADVIRAAGYSRIAANSNEVYSVLFRSNSNNFDRVDITLGFGDLKDARLIEEDVPFGSFSAINISLIPLSIPSEGAVRLGKQ